MTCPTCQPWCARRASQARTRAANLALGVDIYPCHACGSTAWATHVPPEDAVEGLPHWNLFVILGTLVAVAIGVAGYRYL